MKTKTKEERGRRSQNSTPDGALVRPSSAQIQQRGANLMAQAPSPQQDAWLQATAAVARGSTRDRELVQVHCAVLTNRPVATSNATTSNDMPVPILCTLGNSRKLLND